MAAWARYLRGHATLIRELNAELVNEHGLTINDYEVLLHLSHAEQRAMRRVDLASQVLLTAGWVCKRHCESDARVTYAVLTDAGYEKLRAASDFHVQGIRRAFAAHYTEEELGVLADLLSRLGGSEDGSNCTAG